jgi:predicted Zn-dependent protease
MTMAQCNRALPLASTEWIRGGRLHTLMAGRHVARELGVPVAPYIDNLRMHATVGGTGRSLTEMVAATRRGLLLTCVWSVNLVDQSTVLLTGLTRDGVYLIDGGEIVGAVNNFRFGESPVGLLNRLSEVGATEPCVGRAFGEFFTRTAMPPMRVPDFNMQAVSEAV